MDEVATLVDEGGGRALLDADVLDGGRVGRLLQSLGGGEVLDLDLRARCIKINFWKRGGGKKPLFWGHHI